MGKNTWPNENGKRDRFDEQDGDVEVQLPVVVVGMNDDVLRYVVLKQIWNDRGYSEVHQDFVYSKTTIIY